MTYDNFEWWEAYASLLDGIDPKEKLKKEIDNAPCKVENLTYILVLRSLPTRINHHGKCLQSPIDIINNARKGVKKYNILSSHINLWSEIKKLETINIKSIIWYAESCILVTYAL